MVKKELNIYLNKVQEFLLANSIRDSRRKLLHFKHQVWARLSKSISANFMKVLQINKLKSKMIFVKILKLYFQLRIMLEIQILKTHLV